MLQSLEVTVELSLFDLLSQVFKHSLPFFKLDSKKLAKEVLVFVSYYRVGIEL